MAEKTPLEEILDNIPDDQIKAPISYSIDDTVAEGFEEINTFFRENGKPPSDAGDTNEKRLHARLQAISNDPNLISKLTQLDIFNILPNSAPKKSKEKGPVSLDDILDNLELPDDQGDDIFDLNHVPTYKRRMENAEFTSKRRPCEDFDEFRPLFEKVSEELDEGIRETRKFQNEQEIHQGQFFILNGITVYIAEVGEQYEKNGKKNARLRTIFSNGTEGNNLLRSVAVELYKDPNGRRITDPKAGPMFGTAVGKEDTKSGVVYVLRSLSDEPAVIEVQKKLHKIGFTTGSVKSRIANAKKQATYLLAETQIVAEIELFNISSPRSVETLLHRYFEAAKADIKIKDRFGNDVRATEWFLVPLSQIQEAVNRLIAGTLQGSKYNTATQVIEELPNG